MSETAQQQIDRLAKFIMAEVPGEPSQSQGAVDTAIRWMRERLAQATQASGEGTRHPGESPGTAPSSDSPTTQDEKR